MLSVLGQEQKQQRLQQKLEWELGQELCSLLGDEKVAEIMLNPDGSVWIDHLDQGMQQTPIQFSQLQAFNLIGTIADFAGRVVNRQYPILETELPLDGSRFEAVIPTIVSAPTFCIRKQVRKQLNLLDYVAQGILTYSQLRYLEEAILQRKSIVIAGGPGTGKTTFANALLKQMVHLGNPQQRIVLIEDTRELQSDANNTVSLKTNEFADYSALLRATLRLRPDKICLGECRGPEIFVLLKSWNTGTPGGVTTIHANSARAALVRIEEMLTQGGHRVAPHFIAQAIRVIISLQWNAQQTRHVQEIVELTGYENGQYRLINPITYQ